MKDYMSISDICGIVMPFGKYKGIELRNIPVRYLDETISTMPSTWIVRRVWEVVDWAYSSPLCSDRNMTVDQIQDLYDKC